MKTKYVIVSLILLALSVIAFYNYEFISDRISNKSALIEIDEDEAHEAKFREAGYKSLKRTPQEIEAHARVIEDFVAKHGSLQNVMAPNAYIRSLGLTSNWIEAGPNGATTKDTVDKGRTINGRIIAIEPDYSNRKIVYAGTPGGGIWRSTNSGKTWKPAGDNLLGLGVATIACNINMPGEVWFGSGSPYNGINGGEYSPAGYLYKSKDYGVTWTKVTFTTVLPSSVRITKVVLPAIAPNVVVVGTTSGLYLSVDSGKTFSFSSQIGSLIISDVVDVSNFSGTPSLRLLVAIQGSATLKRLTWTGVTEPSTITATTVESITMPNCINPKRIVLTASRTYGHTYVYASVANTNDNFAGIWLSTDRGAEFREKTIPNQAGQMNFNNGIAVHNFNGRRVYLTGGTNTEFYYSLDSTITWQSSTNPTGMHADQHVFTASWFNNDTIYCGSDGGLHIIKNYGTNYWQYGRFRNIEVYNLSVNPSDPFDRYIGTQDNGTIHTFSGVKTDWEYMAGADGFDNAHSPTRHLVSGFPGPYLFSWDVGNTTYSGNLNSFTTGLGAIGNFVYLRFNGTNFYAGGGLNVYKTNGINLPWSLAGGASPTLPGGLFGFDVSPSGDIAAACEGAPSRIPVRVTNSSGNFAAPSSGASASASWWGGKTCWDLKYGTFNSSTGKYNLYGLLSGWQRRIVKSTDGGASFTDITGNLTNDSLVDVNIIVPDPTDPNILYIGGDLGVFATIDGGATWFNFSNHLPTYAYINDMEFASINGFKYLFIGTAGRGVWYSRAIDLSSKVSSQNTSSEVLFKINPNPVTDMMNITIDDADAELIHVQVMDLTGKIMIREKLEINGYNATLNCTALSKGCYIINIAYGNRKLTKKFIKL